MWAYFSTRNMRAYFFLFVVFLVEVRSDDDVSPAITDDEFMNDAPDHGSHWGYLTDTATWCVEYKKCCDQRQSPIDFDTKSLLPELYAPMKFTNYNLKPTEIKIKNNGHTVAVYSDYGSQTPVISDGGLGGKYKLDSFHFHWGSSNDKGAEHTVDGFVYPLELHIVHFNTKYRSLEEAIENTDGVAVIGVFYKIGERDNAALSDVVENLENIKYLDQSATLSSGNVRLNLSSLLPESTEGFYRYAGSLTTPKCQESVVWTVFEDVQTMSNAQIEKFRQLFVSPQDSSKLIPMVDNYRPPQKLYGRKVHRRMISGSAASQNSLLMVPIAGLIISYLR